MCNLEHERCCPPEDTSWTYSVFLLDGGGMGVTADVKKNGNKCMQISFILSSYYIIALLVAMKPLILKGLRGTFLGNFVSKEKANG